MSTFNGLVVEFPDIRIDFFRKHLGLRPPLACFLSHVHSDHLAGLESLRSPFVYCSAATREMLLRLERYPCRINYAKGILEARVQTYKHLKNLLKPLPLETPTTLELGPGKHIQVTLFDANHCPGAVMFLIEDSHHAILYTGDVRSEPWFVNAIARNPTVLEYTSGIKTLDKIFLDTSFIRDVPFQTKAEGIAELLRKVAQYPDDTIFHVQAWTYGYEQVWIALSKALKSRIHVNDYKMRIFASLTGKASNDRFSSSVHLCPEAPALAGYVCGNTPHPGCLTRDENVRLHSCERGNFCSVVRNSNVVSIQPVVAHLRDGSDIAELGVGGGGDDLERDADLDPLTLDDIPAVLALVDEKGTLSQDSRSKVQELLETGAKTGRNVSLDMEIASFGEKNERAILDAFQEIGQKSHSVHEVAATSSSRKAPGQLPRIITFPYSRHSSYQELRDLVRVFQPRDVWPCTVNPSEWLRDNISIRTLFGDCCSGKAFAHDVEIDRVAQKEASVIGLMTSRGDDGNQSSARATRVGWTHSWQSLPTDSSESAVQDIEDAAVGLHSELPRSQFSTEAGRNPQWPDGEAQIIQNSTGFYSSTMDVPQLGTGISRVRADAYLNMARNLLGGDWTPISLLSTENHHTTPDKDLGAV
ncbi:Protein artemis [Colletotrichum chlorophyti]|uniref:Protein artemis n=1 Tax=Colletotrichum chlorophyti TaxID=708187 RepID=A0A1Q8S4E3_9PEZI|nr:Protein artemis [Colletotrichum chlorophyti]